MMMILKSLTTIQVMQENSIYEKRREERELLYYEGPSYKQCGWVLQHISSTFLQDPWVTLLLHTRFVSEYAGQYLS